MARARLRPALVERVRIWRGMRNCGGLHAADHHTDIEAQHAGSALEVISAEWVGKRTLFVPSVTELSTSSSKYTIVMVLLYEPILPDVHIATFLTSQTRLRMARFFSTTGGMQISAIC